MTDAPATADAIYPSLAKAAAGTGVSRSSLMDYKKAGKLTEEADGGWSHNKIMAIRRASKVGNVANSIVDKVDADGVPRGEQSAEQISRLRLKAAAQKEVIAVLEKQGVLVNRHKATDIYALFVKEVREDIKSMPVKWMSRLAAEGLPSDKAEAFLQRVATELLDGIKENALSDNFSERLRDDGGD